MRKMFLMARNQQGRDAVTFKSFTDSVLDEKDRLIINEMITAYDKNNLDPTYYIARAAILSQHKKLRSAFERHELSIIRQVEKEHAPGE
jgi:hypothetical protein